MKVIGSVHLPDFILTRYVHEKATFHYPAGVWDQVAFVVKNKAREKL
jgi:hypothetical protein